jgi:hypothetical protein
MASSSADIEALLVNVRDLDDPTPRQLPAIFRDIVARLHEQGFNYAVLGRIALAHYERARYVSDIEIVVDANGVEFAQATALAGKTRESFASYMDRSTRLNAIGLSLRQCLGPTEEALLAQATTCAWFETQARLASPEHLLWFWCLSDALDHHADADALIRGAEVDLCRVQCLLREVDDADESAQTRLRLALGNAVLGSESSFSRYMEERRARLEPNRIPIWKLICKDD